MAEKKGRCVVLAGGPIRDEELALLRAEDPAAVVRACRALEGRT